MVGGFDSAVLALALLGVSAVVVAQRLELTEDLARVRLVLSTKAASASITVSGATVASYIAAVNSGPPSATVSQIGQVLQLSRNVAGQPAEAQFDVVLADVTPDAAIIWNVATADPNADAQLAVYSLADLGRPALVDRFTSTGSAQFKTTLVSAPVGLRPTRLGPHLVLAHYYPWYTIPTWSDPQMADRPLRLYSTDAQPDINAAAAVARAA